MALDNMGYQCVMKLAKDLNVFSNYGWRRKIDWLKITRACYDEAVRLKGESSRVLQLPTKQAGFLV